MRKKLDIGSRTFQIGLRCLKDLGFESQITHQHITMTQHPRDITPERYEQTARIFLAAVREEQFRRHYFYAVSPATMQQVLGTL